MQKINNSKFKDLMCSGKLSFTKNNELEKFVEKQNSVFLGCSQCSLNFCDVFQFASEAEKSYP